MMCLDRHFRVWLVGVAVLAFGCERKGPLSHDERTALHQTHQLVPRGASERRARKALADRGFALSRLDAGSSSNHLLVATCTRGDTTWQVGLVIVDDKVAATSVTITKAKQPER